MDKPRYPFLDDLLTCCCCWLLGMLIVLISISPVSSYLRPVNSSEKMPDDLLSLTFRMDARNYLRVVEEGYHFDANQRSMVAFFPFYPQLCRLFTGQSDYRAEFVMFVVANVFLFLYTLTLVRLWRGQAEPVGLSMSVVTWSLVISTLLPATFFFRMAYAESMLCFFMALTLLGMQRRWPVWVLAILAGFAAGTRPVGIAVSAAVWWYVVFSRHRTPSPLTPLPPGERGTRSPSPPAHLPGVERGASSPSPFAKYLTMLWVIPLSCWGLLAYMAYLWWAFDAPLAFAQTQEHWAFLAPNNYTFWDKFWSLITLEPIWNVYNPESQRFWSRADSQDNPLFSLLFWNPIFYVFTWLLIGLGWWKRWLKDYEIVLSIGLLLIPYVTRAYEMSMASHARFAAVVIPQYFVLGRLFAMMPPAVAGCLCGLMGLMLGLWTALFIGGYGFF